MAANRDKRASEFGGVPGRIQPAPHEPTTTETLMQVYATEPAPLPPVIPPRVKVTPPRIRPDDPEDFIPVTERRR